MNIALQIVSVILMLVYVVACYIYTWNKPYNFSILAEIPWWAWTALVACIAIELVRHFKQGRN